MQTAKKKTYRKFLLNVVIILNVLALSLALFSYQKGATETKAWYNAGWMYRKSVTVSNPSATVSNADVLVTIDTASLISAGKLQSDCDDLRFLDSDDSTTLSYWIESSCNTSNTQVWVRIPSLPSGGKTIYMYYGNPSAANGQMAWSGNFILFSSVSCADGWVRNSSFDNRFPYGSTTYGTTAGSASHNHGSFMAITGGATQLRGCSDQGCGSTSLNSANHTHTVTGIIDTNSNVWPSYTNTLFCSKSTLEIKSGQIVLYDSLPASGWTRVTAFDNRMPRGAVSHGSTGGADTHNHSVSNLASGINSPATMFPYANCTSAPPRTASRYDHTHSLFSATVQQANHLPPYRNMIFGQANTDTTGLANMVTMATAQPPLGWNIYSNLDSRIPRGYSSAGSTGGSSTHVHSVTVSSPIEALSGNNNPETGSNNVAHQKHGHTVTFDSPSVSNIPPHLTTLFIQRKSSVSTTLAGTEEMYNQAPTAPTELLVEEVTSLVPKFSAVFNDPDPGDTATSYIIQVNALPDFSGNEIWDSGKSSMSVTSNGERSPQIAYNGSALGLDGSTYYWRIKFWDQDDAQGEWSTTSQFKMNRPPNTPTSLLIEGEEYPTNVLDITPEFTAICSDPDGDSCTHYEIEVNTASDFTGDVMWDSGQQAFTTPVTNNEQTPDIEYAGDTLSTTGTYIYNWRIRVWDSDGAVSDWSTVSNFKMAIPPYAPQGLTLNQETMPSQVTEILTFSAIHKDFNQSNGIYYQIQLSRDKGFTDLVWDSGKTAIGPIASDTRTPEIPYTGEQLPLDGSTNYWRMKFWDDDGLEGQWPISQETFTMLDKPSTLTNISGEALTTSTIRWSFTETSDNELGIKIYDENDTLVKTCIGENLTYCDETGLEENTQYTRKLTIYNSEAESDMSESASRYTLVSTPTSPTEVLKTTDSISVTTEQLPNFPEYYFDCQENCTEGVGSWTQSLTAEVTNLNSNTPYSFKVKARNGDGIETEYSNTSTIYTLAEVPTLSAGPLSETSISLNASNINNIASGQSGLYFECMDENCNDGLQEWIKSTSDIVIGLQTNTQYIFQVKARNYDGIETDWTNTVVATHADVPSISQVTVEDFDTLNVTLNMENNPQTTMVLIQESTTGKYVNPSTNLLQTDPIWDKYSNITQPLAVDDLTSGTTYSFKVKAKNLANIETEFSDTVSATTKLSSITALTPTVNSSTEIVWNIDEYSDSILGIKLFDTDGTLVKTCTGTDIHSCTETDLTPNTQYSRKLIIYNDIAESNFSNSVSATTFANTPSLENIDEGEYTYNSVTLNITTNSNPDTTDYLIVEESTGKYVNPETELLQSTPYYATYEEFGAQNGITIYGLQPNSTYSFNIKARNSELIETENSDTRSVATLAQQPSLVSVTAIDTTTLRVIIDAASNPSSTNLMLQEKKSGRYIDPSDGTMKNTASWKAVSQWGGVNGILVKNLSPNTQYSFCTTAKNAIDIATECSQELTAYTLAQTPTITARVTGSSSVELVVDQDGNPNGTQFQVIDTRSGGYIDSNGRFTSSASNIKPDSTISTIQITSLPPNTSYIFRVRSRNLDGVNSNWSSTVPVTTWANTPSNLLFNTVAGSSGKISFSSNGNPNNTQYAIQEVSTGKYVDYSTNTLTDSIVWGTYASWRTTTGVTIRNLEPGKSYSFRVKARNSENVETPYIDGNTGKTYSVIVNKQENLKVGLANNLSVDVSTSEGAQTGVQKVRVMREEYLIADLPISFETNRDWSNAIFESDPQNSKAVVKVDNTHGITDKFTMYVVSGDTNAFRICPQASSLQAVSSTCANSVLYMGEFPQTKEVEGTSVTVSKAQIEGITYWIADGLTGTGGLGEVIEDESTSTGGSFNIPEVTQKLVKQVNQAVEGAISKTIDGLDQTSLGQLEKEELTTIAATTTVVTVSVATTTTLGGISQLGYAFAQVIVNILNTLGFRRKRYPSGYVYNAVTRAPIKQAIVRIFTPDHKLVESAVTDSSGVFWSTLEEGTYMFEVKKRGFSFPSQLIVGREDYPLTDIYHGDITLVKKDGVKVVIPIDPKKATTQSKFITLLRSIFSVLIPILNIALFVIGITITIYMYVKYPTTANMLLGLLYIPATVLLVKSIFNISSSYGKIVYEDRTAAGGITILLKEKEFGKVVEKRVTDENGRYFFDIKERGEYELEIFNKDISVVKGKTSILSKGNTKVVSRLVVKKG